MESTKQAVFVLGDEEYSLDIIDVLTIEKGIKVEPATGLPKHMKGLIHLRGNIIPVYSLRLKFGLEDREVDEDTRYIISNSNNILTAYEVDRMLEIVDVAPNQINEVPSVLKAKDTTYMKAVTNVNGRLVIMLNSNGILSEDDQAKMTAVIEKKKDGGD